MPWERWQYEPRWSPQTVCCMCRELWAILSSRIVKFETDTDAGETDTLDQWRYSPSSNLNCISNLNKFSIYYHMIIQNWFTAYFHLRHNWFHISWSLISPEEIVRSLLIIWSLDLMSSFLFFFVLPSPFSLYTLGIKELNNYWFLKLHPRIFPKLKFLTLLILYD